MTRLLILFDDAGNEGQDDTTIRQHSKKHQRGFLPNIFTQFCSYRGGLDGGQSECHPGTKIMSFSSISYQNGSPRGLLKHTPHKTRRTKTSKYGTPFEIRNLPGMATCNQLRAVPGGCTPEYIIQTETESISPR